MGTPAEPGEWIILETWPDGITARRVSAKGIRYVTERRQGERLARVWPTLEAAQAALRRQWRVARIVA